MEKQFSNSLQDQTEIFLVVFFALSQPIIEFILSGATLNNLLR